MAARSTAPTPTGRRTPAVPAQPAPPTTRLTRLRAKTDQASPAPRMPSTLLSKARNEIRKASNDITNSMTARVAKPAVTSGAGSHAESLKAFLRIRPPPSEEAASSSAKPYLVPQGDKDVIMTAPTDRNRTHLAKPPQLYSFDRVFEPTTLQQDFFAQTALPLVDKVLNAQNGLIFAYGVTNSGKTYTIQGGSGRDGKEESGLLPRALDVIFNSIEGLESKANLRPVGLSDVKIDKGPIKGSSPLFGPDLAEEEDRVKDDTSCKVDRNFSYAIFVSYAEVYNEKIFDLLETAVPAPNTSSASSSRASRAHEPPVAKSRFQALSSQPARSSSMFSGFGHFSSSLNLAAMANGGAGVLRRQALSLKNDPEGNGKYVSGLQEIRVQTRQEAQAVFKSGQRARQVFGTLANRESSRSHGIFTIKVARVHNGAPNDPDSVQMSRLSIVDLAGSERTRNTQNSGDRLREAGNINKSLMVLGQCMEVLRANQQRVQAAGPKKKAAIVPFRHSKLTEIFQNFFVGDGQAVMIVHVNPYDTGFDENAHVMRFSAIAREIQTTAQNKVAFPALKKQLGAIKQAVSIRVMVPVHPDPKKRPVQSLGAASNDADYVMVEEELEVIEDDAEDDGEDEQDPMVDFLFEQIKELKTMLYESEMRNAAFEAEIREEIATEMREVMARLMEENAERLQDQVAAHEDKTNLKLDILQRTMAPELREDTPETEDGNETLESIGSEPLQQTSPTPAGRLGRHMTTLNESASEASDDNAEQLTVGAQDITLDADVSVGNLTLAEDPEDETSEESENSDDTDDDEDEEDDDVASQDSSFAEDESVDSVSVASTPPKTRRVSTVTSTPTRKQTKQPAPSPRSTPLGESVRQSTPGPSADLDRTPDRKAKVDEAPGSTTAPLVSGPDGVDTGIKKKKRQLGKKAIKTEEEILSQRQNVGGAEVRRLVGKH